MFYLCITFFVFVWAVLPDPNNYVCIYSWLMSVYKYLVDFKLGLC